MILPPYYTSPVSKNNLPSHCPVCNNTLHGNLLREKYLFADINQVLFSACNLNHYRCSFITTHNMFLLKYEIIYIDNFYISVYRNNIKNITIYTIFSTQNNTNLFTSHSPLSQLPLNILKQFISLYNFSWVYQLILNKKYQKKIYQHIAPFVTHILNPFKCIILSI